MYNKLIIGLVSILGVFLLVVGVWVYGALTAEPEREVSDDYVQVDSPNDNEDSDRKVVESSVGKTGDNPFGGSPTLGTMTDKFFQSYIHGMSHQKVEASQKWSYYKLTQERVEWLQEALEQSSGIEHKSKYKTILDKWSKGDFSTADDDHNVVWKMQGGTVGKAYDVLSPEDEKAFVESSEIKK